MIGLTSKGSCGLEVNSSKSWINVHLGTVVNENNDDMQEIKSSSGKDGWTGLQTTRFWKE